MTPKFYFDKNGVTTGPFRFKELARLNAQGQIGPETRILTNNGEGEWTTWSQLAENSEERISGEPSRRKVPGDAAATSCRAAALLFLCVGLYLTVATLNIRDWLPAFVSLSFTLAGAAALYALSAIVHWLTVIASKLPSKT